MESILKDLKLKPLIPKFASKKIKPENVSELSNEVLALLQSAIIVIISTIVLLTNFYITLGYGDLWLQPQADVVFQR